MEPEPQSAIGDVLAWAAWNLAPILGVGVSLVYLFTSPRTQPLPLRLLASCAGLLIAVIYCAVFGVALFRISSQGFGLPFLFLLVLPLGAIALSFRYYRGSRVIHSLQLVNVAVLIWTAFIGGMAVTGQWL